MLLLYSNFFLPLATHGLYLVNMHEVGKNTWFFFSLTTSDYLSIWNSQYFYMVQGMTASHSFNFSKCGLTIQVDSLLNPVTLAPLSIAWRIFFTIIGYKSWCQWKMHSVDNKKMRLKLLSISSAMLDQIY